MPQAQAGHSPLVPFQTTDLASDSGSGPMGDGTGHGPAHCPVWYLETSTRLARLAVLKAAGHRACFHLRASAKPDQVTFRAPGPPGAASVGSVPFYPHQGDTTQPTWRTGSGLLNLQQRSVRRTAASRLMRWPTDTYRGLVLRSCVLRACDSRRQKAGCCGGAGARPGLPERKGAVPRGRTVGMQMCEQLCEHVCDHVSM